MPLLSFFATLCLLLQLFLSSSLLMAITDDDNYANEKMTRPECLRPFKLFGSIDVTGRGRACEEHYKGQKLSYLDVNANGTATVYFNKLRSEAIQLVLGYEKTRIDWYCHPWICQEKFNTLRLGVNFLSGRLSSWMWQGYVNANVDADEWSLSHYTSWDALLWGRCQLCYPRTMALNLGFLAQTGMKIDHVYPIFGIDWCYGDRWKFNLVFPIKVSAEYEIASNWTTGLSSRFLESRHRFNPEEPLLPMGLIQYRSVGAEWFLSYDNCSQCSANIHAGWLFGSNVKLSNRHNHHGRWFKFGGSGYAGAELALKF